MLKFKVENQIIKRTDSFEVIADSRNYLTAEFEFSSEWTDEKTAVFGYNGKFYHMVLDNDSCLVPWEVIRAPYFSLSVFSGSLLNTNMILVKVGKSGLDGGEIPGTPTPTIWQEYIDELAAKNQEIADNMETEVSANVLQSAKTHANTVAATAQSNAIAQAETLAQSAQSAAINYANEELAKKADIEDVPTKLSELSDDVGYAKKTDIAGVYKYKGEISSAAELEAVTNPEIGDTYNVTEDITCSFDMLRWNISHREDGMLVWLVEPGMPGNTYKLLCFADNETRYPNIDSGLSDDEKIVQFYNAEGEKISECLYVKIVDATDTSRGGICLSYDTELPSAWEYIKVACSYAVECKSGDNIAWNGTSWDNLSGFVDLSPYAEKTDVASDIEAAKTQAIETAASDASSKANQTLSSAKAYTDEQIDEITIPVMSETEYASAVFTSDKIVIVLPDGTTGGA